MVVGEMAEPADLLVVGGGPGGYVAALRAAQLGRQVTLVEREGNAGLGGCCLHVGCIPSKALIEVAEQRHRTLALAVAGLQTDGVRIDMGQFQQWKTGVTSGLADGVARLLKQAGVEVVQGDLRFNRRDRAAVRTPDGNVRFLEFRHAIVATGSRPVQLPAFPVDQERILDSTGALALARLPASMAVVGGGYIGLEIGTALAKLGTHVTVVEALDRVLPTLDAELSAPLSRRSKELGMEVLVRTRAVELDGDQLVVETPDGRRRVDAELVVVAIGRTPNTDELGLDAAGLSVDEDGLIPVGADMRANERIAAIGDVVAGPALAHKAMHEGVVAAEALSGLPAEMDVATIPRVIFSDPELALTGLTRDEAQAAGIDVRVAKFPLAASGRARTMEAGAGFVQVVAEEGSDRVVGVQIVGPHASELIAEGSLAVEMVATVDDLAGTIHAHPTLGEGVAEAASILAGRPVHVAGGAKR
jgi:dihydrolipoamide dehydrogenase